MLFDTHLHLIYPERLSYPWLENVPALNKPNTLEDYIARARRLGISGCFNMEVDVAEKDIEAETDLVTELMSAPESPLKGAISACRPEHETFAAFLERNRENPTIRGFRRILHAAPDGTGETETFRDNVKRLSGTGLTFDLCIFPSQNHIGTALVDHCPDVQFILDHCGVPDIKANDFETWSTGISEIAKRPNVTAKISGVIAYADGENWALSDIRRYVDHVVSSFGHDRLVWGSDNPVCNLGGGLETWVATTRAITADWLKGDREALYSGNAARIWNL